MTNGFTQIAQAARTSFVDAVKLETELRAAVRGDVRFDAAAKALYATDGSNFRQIPIGVVRPRDSQVRAGCTGRHAESSRQTDRRALRD